MTTSRNERYTTKNSRHRNSLQDRTKTRTFLTQEARRVDCCDILLCQLCNTGEALDSPNTIDPLCLLTKVAGFEVLLKPFFPCA